MSTHKNRLTVVQRAAAHSHSPALSVSELLDLYLTIPSKLRDEQFVSTACAAEIAGISQRTIELWIDSGALAAIRIGKNFRVSRDSLGKYVRVKNG